MNNVENAVNAQVKANEVYDNLMANQAANVGDIREEATGFNKEVFDLVKTRLTEEGVAFGSSNSDSRFWLL